MTVSYGLAQQVPQLWQRDRANLDFRLTSSVIREIMHKIANIAALRGKNGSCAVFICPPYTCRYMLLHAKMVHNYSRCNLIKSSLIRI